MKKILMSSLSRRRERVRVRALTGFLSNFLKENWRNPTLPLAGERKKALISKGMIWLLLVYRMVVSPFLPPACRFHPSCSEYAMEAIREYGAVRGGRLSLKRLLRCHPWGGHGYDPVITKEGKIHYGSSRK